MKNKLKFTIGLCVIFVLISLLTFKGYVGAQNEKNIQKREITSQPQSSNRKTKNQEDDDKATPKVLYPVTDTKVLDLTSQRFIRNKGYDKSDWVLEPKDAELAGVAIRNSEKVIPAIPAKESNLILIGTVIDSQAFLSNDKTGIYSEFTTQIESVIKNLGNQNINIGEVLSVTRTGGIVQYPSGKNVRYKIPEKGSPEINSKYVFFLKQVSDGWFKILTAYEVKGDSVFPLDGDTVSLVPGGELANENVQAFIDQIKKADLNK